MGGAVEGDDTKQPTISPSRDIEDYTKEINSVIKGTAIWKQLVIIVALHGTLFFKTYKIG